MPVLEPGLIKEEWLGHLSADLIVSFRYRWSEQLNPVIPAASASPLSLWSLFLLCASTAGLFRGILCTMWWGIVIVTAVTVYRCDVVLGLPLGMSDGMLRAASPAT